jgi:hypothetical protein
MGPANRQILRPIRQTRHRIIFSQSPPIFLLNQPAKLDRLKGRKFKEGEMNIDFLLKTWMTRATSLSVSPSTPSTQVRKDIFVFSSSASLARAVDKPQLDFPKFTDKSMASKMSTMLSLLMSAFPFHVGLSGIDAKAFESVIAS